MLEWRRWYCANWRSGFELYNQPNGLHCDEYEPDFKGHFLFGKRGWSIGEVRREEERRAFQYIIPELVLVHKFLKTHGVHKYYFKQSLNQKSNITFLIQRLFFWFITFLIQISDCLGYRKSNEDLRQDKLRVTKRLQNYHDLSFIPI